jgi:hypothetical protein
MSLSKEDVQAIVRATIAEQNSQPPTDQVIMKAIATILTSFGIEEEDRNELRADFVHLRKWRKSVEQAEGLTMKAVVGIIVSGVLGAMWLGFKTLLGK